MQQIDKGDKPPLTFGLSVSDDKNYAELRNSEYKRACSDMTVDWGNRLGCKGC